MDVLMAVLRGLVYLLVGSLTVAGGLFIFTHTRLGARPLVVSGLTQA